MLTRQPAINGAQLSADNYALLQREVYSEPGIVLDGSKLYLIEARLNPILEEEQIKTLNDLCALMKVVGARHCAAKWWKP